MAAPSVRAAATIMQCIVHQTNYAAPPLLNNHAAKALFSHANQGMKVPALRLEADMNAETSMTVSQQRMCITNLILEDNNNNNDHFSYEFPVGRSPPTSL